MSELFTSYDRPRDSTGWPLDKRSAREAMYDILCVVSKGVAKPTHILYRANLSWSIMRQYLNVLVRHGFIEQRMEGIQSKWVLTEKGLNFAKNYSRLMDEINPVMDEFFLERKRRV